MPDDLAGSRFARRAELESWIAHRSNGARLEYRRDLGGWTVTAIVPLSPETIVVSSGPTLSIEAGCVVVMHGLAEARLAVPDAWRAGDDTEPSAEATRDG
jgi:hypothetical protein